MAPEFVEIVRVPALGRTMSADCLRRDTGEASGATLRVE